MIVKTNVLRRKKRQASSFAKTMIRILFSTIRIQCTDMDIMGNDLQMTVLITDLEIFPDLL